MYYINILQVGEYYLLKGNDCKISDSTNLKYTWVRNPHYLHVRDNEVTVSLILAMDQSRCL